MDNLNKTQILTITMALISFAVVFSLGVSTAAAANSSIYVNTAGNDTWDGQNSVWNGTSGPKATITNATSIVAENGTIYIANGTYNEHNIPINTNMNIIGESQQSTIINGTNSGPIFYVAPLLNVSIFNLTLTNGNNVMGGSIYSDGNLTVANSTFYNNNALYGGGIYNDYDGTLAVANSTFYNNNAPPGYGGALFNYGTMTVTNSTIHNNYAAYAGAISNGGYLTVINSTLNNNTAIYNAGAIFTNGYMTVINSTINNNIVLDTSAGSTGGAIYNGGGVWTVTNSALNNNTAVYGGAIYDIYGDPSDSISFSQIINNGLNQIYEDGSSMIATLNWWGSNNNPSGNVFGSVDVTSWLVLNITAVPSTIFGAGNSTVTADLQHDNNGNYYDPANGHVPDGIPVTFTVSLGGLSPLSSTMVNGQAQSIFTANSAGAASVTATVDSQMVSAPITVNPATTQLVTGAVNGFKGSLVNLTATLTDASNNVPVSGKTINFSVNGTSVGSATTNASGIATLPYTITLSAGIYQILCQFTGDTLYAGANGTNNLTVNLIPTQLIVGAVNGLKGKSVNLTATLTDTHNHVPVSGKTINFSVNGTSVGSATTNASGIATLPYTITLNAGIYSILAKFAGDTTYATVNGTNNLTVPDTIAPTVTVNPVGGLYNVNKVVTLTTTDPDSTATTYYTTDGSDPKTSATRHIYSTSLTITTSTILRYIAVDPAGLWSPNYTQTYTIDKVPPKVTSTSPANGATKVSRTATISIKFSENIKTSTNWTKIYMKNLTTGKLVTITASITGNTLNIKMKLNRLPNNVYQVYIPAAAVKDNAGNNLAAAYSFKFKSV